MKAMLIMQNTFLIKLILILSTVLIFAGCTEKTQETPEKAITVNAARAFTAEGYTCEVAPLLGSLGEVSAAALGGSTLYAVNNDKLYTVDLSTSVKRELKWFVENGIDASVLAVGTDVTLWFARYNGEIRAYSADGELLYEYAFERGANFNFLSGLFTLPDGKVGASVLTPNGYAVYVFELGQKPVEATALSQSSDAERVNYAGIAASSGELLCWNNIRVFTVACGENYELSGTELLLFEWLDIDIGGGASVIGMPDDETVVILTADSKLKTVRKIPIPPEQKDKIELVLAVVDTGANELIQAAAAFNAADPDYKVRVVVYTDPLKFATEFIAGEMPDLISVPDNRLDTYAKQGVFEPLEPFFDADDDVELLPQIRKLFEVDGKLYSVAPYFIIRTTYGHRDFVGENCGWTFEEMLEAFGKCPDGAVLITGFGLPLSFTNVQLDMVEPSIGQFVDWDNGTVSFDSDDFKNLLEFAKLADTSNKYSIDTPLASGMLFMNWKYLSRFEDITNLDTFLGGNLVFKGYPNSGRVMGFIHSTEFPLSITSGCSDKEGAWRFLRYMLTEYSSSALRAAQYGYSIPASEPGFYTERSRFNKQVSDIMEKAPAYAPTPLTESQYERFLELLDGSQKSAHYELTIMKIIDEETSSFFAGQKSADEVCAIIQSRVQLYVGEQQ